MTAEVAKEIAAAGAPPVNPESPKPRKKRFGLFKRKKAPKTPDTVSESPVKAENDVAVTGGKNLLSELDLAATDGDNGAEAEGMEMIPVKNDEPAIPTKPKKKKFGLFKRKKAPKIPDTASETPLKPEEDVAVTGGKNLLSELDLAATDGDNDAEAEGMELILPAPEYEVEEEEKQEVNEVEEKQQEVANEVEPEEETNKVELETDAEIKKDEVNETEAQPEEEPVNESQDANVTTESPEGNTTEKTDDTKLNESEETNDTLNQTNESEEEKKEDESQSVVKAMKTLINGDAGAEEDSPSVVDTMKTATNKATDAALKVLQNALKCTGIDPNTSCDSLRTDVFESSFLNRSTVDLDMMFDEKSGTDFLHDMTNVGFTLIHHTQVDEETWAGRTVNMIFRPGVCTSEKIVQPAVEWSTMEGGKSNAVETKTLELMSIDAVATNDEGIATDMSSLPIPAKPPTGNESNEVNTSMCSLSCLSTELEGMECFFTITSKDGEVHLFEALDMKECHGLVAGIRFSAQRLSQILIEGNSSVLTADFYDDSREPAELKLSKTEVLNKLSNAFLDAIFAEGQNVVATSSGVAIGTNGGNNGLVVSTAINGERRQIEITSFGGGVSVVSSFDDVSIDPINESLVFAMSATDMTVCSFVLDGTATDENSILQLVGCVGIFSTRPFCGVSAYGGTLMISGGTGGFTIYEYDQQSGEITDTPTLLNQRFPNIVGHPDVILVNANLAALSTDFVSVTSRFGTQMASIDASRSSVVFGSDYRVQDSLGFQLFIQPSNFPLVNAVYRSFTASSMPLMYTANGSMQVQDLASDEILIIDGAPDGFSAVTVSVHQAEQKLYFGGVLASGGSLILVYDLSDDPMNPILVESKQADNQRITSIASGGDAVVFMSTTNPGTIQFMDLLPTANLSSESEPHLDHNFDHNSEDVATNGSVMSPTDPASNMADASGARSFSLQVGCLLPSVVLVTMLF